MVKKEKQQIRNKKEKEHGKESRFSRCMSYCNRKNGGALSNTPAADLGAIVIKEALNRAGVKPEMVDEVKMGCVIQAAQGQNVARQAADQGRTSDRGSGNHDQRCLRIRSEMCK